MMNTNNVNKPYVGNQSSSLESQKILLESKKLEQEINQLKLAWWKRPSYIASSVTLVALLTGWISGYFPGEKQKLDAEIKNLRSKKIELTTDALLLDANLNRLRRELNKIQQEIDKSYITLSLELAEANYALAHFEGVPELSESDLQRIQELLKTLTTDDRNRISALEHAYSVVQGIGPQATLSAVTPLLELLPASEKAKSIRIVIDPMHKGGGLFRAIFPDGTEYPESKNVP